MARIEIVPAIGQFGGTRVAFSPDGRFAFSATLAVKLWERSSGRLIRTFYDPAGMSPAVVSPDGNRLATGSWRQGSLKLWDVSSGEVVRVFADEFASDLALLRDAYLKPIEAVAFSPDGARVLAVRKNLLNLWDIASGQMLFEQDVYGDFDAVVFSPDGTHFLVPGRPGLELRDAANGEVVRTLIADPPGAITVEPVTTISFAPDGRHALSVKGATLSLWDVARGALLRTIKDPEYSRMACAVFSPDGAWVLSGGRDRRAPEGHALKLWDVATGQAVGSLESRLGSVASVALAPDGACALAGNPPGLVFARSARQIRYAATDGVPELLDMATRRAVGAFKSHIRPVTAVAFSRDGTRFVASSYACHGNSTLHLWDAKSGRQLRAFEEGGTHVTSVALSGDGTLVLAGGGLTGVGKSLRLWDAATGELRHTFAQPERLGGSYWAYACAFAPDGACVVSGSSDEDRLKLWDVASGRVLRTFGATSGVGRVLLGWNAALVRGLGRAGRHAQAMGRGERRLAAFVHCGEPDRNQRSRAVARRHARARGRPEWRHDRVGRGRGRAAGRAAGARRRGICGGILARRHARIDRRPGWDDQDLGPGDRRAAQNPGRT